MRSLPKPGEPLERDDGSILTPSKAKVSAVFSRVEVPSHSEAQRLVTDTRRRLVDLPALPREINTYSVVLVYTASGLRDDEIGAATGLTVDQIRHIREQDAYQQLESYVVEAVKEQAASEVTSILAEGEVKAARKVTELVDSEDSRVALRASQDVLDRRGHRPMDKSGTGPGMGGLTIVVVDQRDVKNVPSITIDQ